MFPHFPRESLDFTSRDHVLVHHAYEKLFHRTRPETLDKVAHGARGHTGRGDVRPIDEGVTGDLMAEVPARFEAAQQRAHARIFQRVRGAEGIAYLFGGGRSFRPDDVQNRVLKLSQRPALCVTRCHVTICNTNDAARQALSDR